MQSYLTGDGLLKAALVILAICWAWNMVYTAITNARKERERQDAPLNEIRDDIRKLNDGIHNDRERITALEHDIEHHGDELRDLHHGQTEICRGVQALLEHALHNGNTDEMEAASQAIGKWLRTR
jgi:septal ring factor EnvC (AmiA/AmiB activator)